MYSDMSTLSIRGHFNEASFHMEKQKWSRMDTKTKVNNKRNSIPRYSGSLKGQQLGNMYFA